jgi:hypothetical protein
VDQSFFFLNANADIPASVSRVTGSAALFDPVLGLLELAVVVFEAVVVVLVVVVVIKAVVVVVSAV